MFSAFLNPWMLAGLAGVLLPVIAHLLSRKKYDIVDWGAMQFLEVDPSAKRRMRLEEFLLLLMRMLAIAIVALALARPWLSGQWLAGLVVMQPRDLVLVLDGSYSTGWEGGTLAPSVRALQLARQLLKDVRAGDTIQIIDARERPRVLFDEPTHDIYRVREALNDMPSPSASADIPAALNRAVQVLASGSNLKREVILFTDQQSLSWKAGDANLWARFDDVRGQSSIPPRVWVIDSSNGELGQAPNFTIDRIQLSRELAVAGIPIKISSKIRSAGGADPTLRKVYFEIDQQRINDQTVQLKLPPQGETTVNFEYRFDTPGSHLISLVLDDDALPGDNRSHAVVSVMDSLPVLFVDGDKKLDPTKSETFFAAAALRASDDEASWIKATFIEPDGLTADRLAASAVVVLANVGSLGDSIIQSLQQFVSSGHGLLFTLGDQVKKDAYHRLFEGEPQPLLPVRLDSLSVEDENTSGRVRVANNSLELPWLRPFRTENGGSLGDARWSTWWKVSLAGDVAGRSRESPAAENPPVDADPVVATKERIEDSFSLGSAVVEARLSTGDPLIVSRRYGRGVTSVWTSSLDADWNTLPAKQDYVPFLYELLFSLASVSTNRNVPVGSPLILPISKQLKIQEYQFLNPENKSLSPDRIEDAFEVTARLPSTTEPGVYRFVRKTPKANDANRPEYFAVDFDRSESDLTTLTAPEKEALAGDERMKFVKDLPDLQKNMIDETARAEFWWVLLYVFLFNLVVEAWMTRRMVRGGYASSSA